ncbi:hypothetical protein RRG08_022343 [Elysia crispata]|uniref:Uncharacterized protein n=1 Tax=Elysia crispata TaxID=231223 RepID=A0AAE1D8R9_9GAST|nr:hypothetical protein RRG08_022343 [Elysia crispata]
MPVIVGRVAVLGLTLAALPASAVLICFWYRYQCREAANRKRADQGNHECEVFALGQYEAMEGNRRWKGCTKNPGHLTFIPITEFSMGHLPEAYQIQEVFDLITNISARTVRLRVGYTSLARPKGYVFSEFGGQRTSHTGSGWVRDFEVRNGPCRCRDCDGKNTIYNKWWLLRVYTSCHVVYDTSEAVETEVDLFYDSEASRKSARSIVTMKGIKATYRDEDPSNIQR